MTHSMFRTFLFFSVLAWAAWPAAAFEIRGKVVDQDEAPVDDARAWLFQGNRTHFAETEASGAFVFPEAEAGLSHLVVWKDGAAIAGHTGVVVGPETFTFRIGPPARFDVRVIDQAYRPIAGARISRLVINQDVLVPVDDLVAGGFPSARSDEEGFLSFTGLPERCAVEVRLAHREYVAASLPLLPVGQKTWTLQLHEGALLRGRAVNDGGKGIAEGLVSALDVGNEETGERFETRTDPEGYYRLNVPPGIYDVGVRHAAHSPAMPQRVEINSEADDQVVNLTLLPPRFVEGRILQPDSAPAVGVWVAYAIEAGLYDETVTNGEGVYRLKACPGPGRLQVYPPDGFLVRDGNQRSVEVEGEVTRVPKLRLDPLPEINGFVLGPDGEAEPNVLISSLDLQPPVWLITDPEGKFHIQLDRAPSGKARFRAEQALRFLRADFEVDLHELPEVDVSLAAFKPDQGSRETPSLAKGLADLKGTAAPELEVDSWLNLNPSPNGESESPSLESLMGNVIVLTFWSGFDDSGEGRFRIEELRALHDLFRFADADDVIILGIHDGMSPLEDVRRYIEQYRINFPVAKDTDSSDTFERYKVRTIPQTVLIDRAGILRFFNVEGRLLELIKTLRREAPPVS